MFVTINSMPENEKKTRGVCAFCGKPIYLSRYDVLTHRERWVHFATADGKQAGHIAKLKHDQGNTGTS